MRNEKAFKKYIIREVTDKGAVFEREILLALPEELEVSPPSLEELEKNSTSTKQLKKNLSKNPILSHILVSTAINAGWKPPTSATLMETLKKLLRIKSRTK